MMISLPLRATTLAMLAASFPALGTTDCPSTLLAAGDSQAPYALHWVQFKTNPRPWNFRRVDKNYISANSERAWVAEPELWTTTFTRNDGLVFKQAMRERENFERVRPTIRVEGFLEDSPFYAYQAYPQLGGRDDRQAYTPETGVRTPTLLNTSDGIERIDLHLRAWVDGMIMKSAGNRREVPVASLEAYLPQTRIAVLSLETFQWNVRGPRNAQITDQNRLILRSLVEPGPDGQGANRSFTISYPYPSKSRGFKTPQITSVLGVFDESVLLVVWSDGSFAAYSVADGKLLARFQIPAEAQHILAGNPLIPLWVRDAQPEEKWLLPLERHKDQWAYLALQPGRLLAGDALSIELKPEVPFLSGSIEERMPRSSANDPQELLPTGFQRIDQKRRQPVVQDRQGNWWVLLPKTSPLR